jgi:hypothetical protein
VSAQFDLGRGNPRKELDVSDKRPGVPFETLPNYKLLERMRGSVANRAPTGARDLNALGMPSVEEGNLGARAS